MNVVDCRPRLARHLCRGKLVLGCVEQSRSRDRFLGNEVDLPQVVGIAPGGLG